MFALYLLADCQLCVHHLCAAALLASSPSRQQQQHPCSSGVNSAAGEPTATTPPPPATYSEPIVSTVFLIAPFREEEVFRGGVVVFLAKHLA